MKMLVAYRLVTRTGDWREIPSMLIYARRWDAKVQCSVCVVKA